MNINYERLSNLYNIQIYTSKSKQRKVYGIKPKKAEK